MRGRGEREDQRSVGGRGVCVWYFCFWGGGGGEGGCARDFRGRDVRGVRGGQRREEVRVGERKN